MHISNKKIVELLRSVATAYILTGANKFRIIAYQKAADTVEHMNQELYDIWENQGLAGVADVSGIGPTISQHLDQYFNKIEGSYLQRQLESIPATVYELMKAPGIGPKKAFRIAQEFNLENRKTVLDDVLKLAKQHRIAVLEGFGEKSEQDIIGAIRIYLNRQSKEDRMALPEGFNLAQNVIEYIQKGPSVEHVQALGSLRRMVATIGDIDLAVVTRQDRNEKILKHFVDYPQRASIEGQGKNKAAIITKNGKRIDMRIIDKDRYGSMLQYFTGSKAHNIKLREYALKKGYSLNEFGIKHVASGKVHIFNREEDLYALLGLDYIPPEIREGTDEIKRAFTHRLPDLVEEGDIKGDFHIHSSFAIEPSHDLGQHSFEEIIKKALERRYAHIAFSEHNPSVAKHTAAQMASLIKRKRGVLQKLQKHYPKITLLNSLEVDILPNGELAVPEEAMHYLDLAIVSIHSAFAQTNATMTDRIIKALKHPKVKIFGHPTARLINRREEIDADWRTIFKAAANEKIAIEINSHPDRLDLPDSMVRQAIASGCSIVINTDTHHIDHMDNMFFGVAVARRGWAEKKDVINTYDTKRVKAWLEK